MKISGRTFSLILFPLLCLVSFAVIEGHVPIYINPPPYVPGDMVGPNGNAPPNPGPSSPGGPTTGPAPIGPITSGPSTGGPGGGVTRKRKPVTSVNISWENWWARNRFQYLDIPIGINTSVYPSTPEAGNHAAVKSVMNSQSCVLLRPYLKSPLARVKRASIIGLARLNDTQSLAEITSALTCNNQTVRDNALMALGLINSPLARYPLLHIAEGKKEAATRFLKQSSVPDYFQAFALISLTLGKTKGIAPVLKSVVNSSESSNQVKAMALECMGHLGGSEQIRFLMDFIENGKKLSNELVAMAVIALAKTDDPACLPYLKKCLSSRSKPMVQSAALGVGRLARPNDIQLVNRLFGLYRASSDKAIKGFSLISMGRIGGAEAVKHLDHVITHGQSSDCGWACLSLGLALRNQPDKAMMNRLMVQARSHANRSVRGAAVISLGLMGDKRAVPTLIQILKKGDNPVVRCYAATALGILKDKDGLAPLREALRKDGSPNVISESALALAIMRDTESIDYLTDQLLKINNDYVQTFIALGLSFMGDMKIYNRITKALKEQELEEITKLHCIHLLSKLVSGTKIPFLDPVAMGSNFACEYPLVNELLLSGI